MNRTLFCMLSIVALVGCSGSAPDSQTAAPETPVPGTAPEPTPPVRDDVTSVDLSASPRSAFRRAPRADTPPATGQHNLPIASVDPDELARIHDLTQRFYDGEFEAVFDSFSDEMKGTLSLEQLRQLHERVSAEYGKETEIVGEQAATNNDIRAFVRWARFDGTDAVIRIEWYLRPDDSVAGFFIEPAGKPGEGGQ